MAQNPWDFGDDLTEGVNAGLNIRNTNLNAKKVALEEEAGKRAAVKAKFDQTMSMADKGIEFYGKKDLPVGVRLQYLNNLTIPALQQLGLPAQEVTSIDDPERQKLYDQGAAAYKAWRKGEIDFGALKMSLGEVGSKLKNLGAEDTFSQVADHLIPKPTVTEFASGPNGEKTTQVVDTGALGGGKPISTLGTGTPQPTAGSGANDIRSKAIDDIRDAIRIKANIKQSGFDALLSMWPERWRKPTNKEGMVNQANLNMALRGKDLGLPDDTIHKLANGELGIDELLTTLGGGQTAAAPNKADPNAMVKVELDGKVGQIPAKNLADFQKAHPKATVHK